MTRTQGAVDEELDLASEVEAVDESVVRLVESGRSWQTCFGHPREIWPDLLTHLSSYDRPITVYAGGIHIGCEVYTLAMHLLAAGIESVRIVASDANAPCLEVAERGVYERAQIGHDVAMGRLDSAWTSLYFEEVGKRHLRVAAPVRDLVRFTAASWLPRDFDPAGIDVVSIRNVWQHLQPAQRQVLVASLEHLPADGLVFARHAFWDEIENVMEPAGRYIYHPPLPGAHRSMHLGTMRPGEDWLADGALWAPTADGRGEVVDRMPIPGEAAMGG